MADFETRNTPDGYVVYGHFRTRKETSESWHPMKNFGDYQSDAYEYRNYDCPKFTDTDLNLIASNFDIKRLYKRLGFKKYGRQ